MQISEVCRIEKNRDSDTDAGLDGVENRIYMNAHLHRELHTSLQL